MGKEGDKIDGFIAQLSQDVAACKLETFKWTDYQILLCINTLMTNDKDEARLAEKLTACFNAYCEAKTTMTLATVQTKVKKFRRDIKETRDLMFSGKGILAAKKTIQVKAIKAKIMPRKRRARSRRKRTRTNQAVKRLPHKSLRMVIRMRQDIA